MPDTNNENKVMATKPLEEGREAVAQTAKQKLEIIRTDTVISKLPAHNLFGQGSMNIQINKKDANGQTKLSWKVSFNQEFGEAGQLAYRIETLLINRRIDEAGRPVPAMIRLGSLSEICEELGINPSGANTNNLKRALQQNAGALITANLSYKGTDGTKNRLEATFTKYSVAFRGDELPNGEKSDGVVILLNEQYRRVLNRAGTRPLDFQYLKQLTPSAQRFYEIISYQLYAALKYHYPEAKITYSDYCAYSGQPRQYEAAEMNKRMYKIHQPHIKSGYISKVSYQKIRDSEGRVDWVMSYVPGPRAVAEFERFNRRLFVEDHSRDLDLANEARVGVAESEALRLLKHFHLSGRGKRNYEPRPGAAEIRQAEEVINRLGYEGGLFLVEYAVAEAKKTNFKMAQFGGAMQYLSEAEEAWKVQLQRQRERAEQEETLILNEFDWLKKEEEIQRRAEEKLGSLAPEAYSELAKEVRKTILERSPAAAYWDEETMASSIKASIRLRMINEIIDGEERRTQIDNSPFGGQ
jgi:hypothetical protein